MKTTVSRKQIKESDQSLLAARDQADALLINGFKMFCCPYCGKSSIRKYGCSKKGVQRYFCNNCKRTFSPVTGSLLDSHALSISEWVKYSTITIENIKQGTYNPEIEPRIIKESYRKIIFCAVDAFNQKMVFGKKCILSSFKYLAPQKDYNCMEGNREQSTVQVPLVIYGIIGDCIILGHPGIVFELESSQKEVTRHIPLEATLLHHKCTQYDNLIKALHLREAIYEQESHDMQEEHNGVSSFLDQNGALFQEDPNACLHLYSFLRNFPGSSIEQAMELLKIALRVSKRV